MKEPDWQNCSEEQLWRFVAWHLARKGIESVLVGGSVVSIYSEGIYRSGDIDLITYEQTISDLDKAMKEIGFNKRGMHYRHPKCRHIFVQSVSGPLGIGNDIKIKPREVKTGGQIIKILTPTDCVRDRLSAYIYDGVRALFDQAVLVAKHQPFEPKKVEKWLRSEGRPDLIKEFQEAVKRKISE